MLAHGVVTVEDVTCALVVDPRGCGGTSQLRRTDTVGSKGIILVQVPKADRIPPCRFATRSD